MSLVFRQVRPDLILMATSKSDISDEEWAPYIDRLKHGEMEGKPITTLVFTDGGAPNPVQRKQYASVAKKAPPVSVVTGSAIARGVIVTFSWIGIHMRAYAPHQVRSIVEDHALDIATLRAFLRQAVIDLGPLSSVRDVLGEEQPRV